jgi:glutathione S-transferase
VKLYVYSIAPNPTKVRLYLAEKRAAGAALDVDEITVDLRRGEQHGAAHLARHRLGKLPVLELDDGTCLAESLPIIEFLEETCPAPTLFGCNALERARVRQLERIADQGVLVPVAGIIHATRSPLGWPPNPGLAEFLGGVLPRALAYLDDVLADGRPFLAGAGVSIADCTLAAALQFARFGRLPMDPALVHLARWDGAYRTRPAARSVLVR